ncbi:hypothetical protein OUZ56_017682 [Daphnia magna]|uniref:Uncharacterized protein n=1 Tax=Daphnia magna TaxID=35525 RepID=A0ABR0ATF1_9CRUS|nr:hypothetical protein OUZ56_017682 [Daphnia magna]
MDYFFPILLSQSFKFASPPPVCWLVFSHPRWEVTLFIKKVLDMTFHWSVQSLGNSKHQYQLNLRTANYNKMYPPWPLPGIHCGGHFDDALIDARLRRLLSN